ncbi:MAG TPA: methylmalonyl-CoA mutase family protein [Ilumatobacter sp.]|nr:methylmalonyl-CoA mutase family protein [Ilumatobacter sp.]
MSETLPLAADFPAVTEADWLAAVRSVVLKGKPDATDADFAAAFERQLVNTTADGFAIQPLYTTAPAASDITRGLGADPAPWEVRQRVSQPGQATTELESGATGLLVDGDPRALLDGVHLHMVPISLADGALAGALIDLWEAHGTPVADRAGTLGVDPIGAWARTGGTTDLADGLAAAGELLTRVVEHPAAVRVLVADGTLWHEAGATPAQELAWTVAAAVHYVRTLGDTAASRLEFRWAADADQFTTIAKLRAARQLWARVVSTGSTTGEGSTTAHGSTTAARHHAETSRVMLTRYDTWTNTLRSTVACFAAGVGGADAVTVLPHDALISDGGSALGRRIARNTQTILQSESHLWRVRDIAGGSWYVESLTDQLAAAAWDELTRIDAAGGLIAAVEQGTLHAALDEVLTARATRLATRKQPLTGLSEFPNIDEEPPPAGVQTLIGRLTEPPFEPFGLHRLADGFEGQRARADQHWRLTGERPTVYLATLGTAAQFTARATFAKNLFEAGGIRTVAGSVADMDASTSVACLCSSDPVYAEQGAAATAKLRAAGATRLYVAGRKLELAGVDEEIGVGSDVLDVLTRTLDHLLAAREEVSA